MNNRIQDYFKIGTLQWMSYPPERYDLVETVREICKDEYFSVIEIAHISDPEERKRVKKMLEQSMIEISYGAQPPRFGFPGSANDEETVIDFFEVLKKYGFADRENPYILSMEVKPREYEDGDLVIANTKRMINRAWARLKE